MIKLTREQEHEQLAEIVMMFMFFLGSLIFYPVLVEAFTAAFRGGP